MTRIAFASDEANKDLVDGDRDLRDALEEKGHSVEAAVWTEPEVSWSEYDLVLIRSTWDYETKYKQFLNWIDQLEANDNTVWNPPEVLRWNSNKQYLKELERSGVLIPPSFIVPPGASPVPLNKIMEEKNWKDVVVKPLVGGGAHKLQRFDESTVQEGQKHLDALTVEHGAMVQKFLPEVTDEGEWSFIFTGNELSHTVLKQPESGDYRVQKALGGTREHRKAPEGIRAQARDYVQKITDPYLYLRLDGIVRNERLHVLEVEMIEPRLYLAGSDEGVQNMANAIDTALQDGLSVEYFQTAVPSEMDVNPRGRD